MSKNNVFSAADILLPSFAESEVGFPLWSVIACDQFTSDPGYWKRVEENVGENRSAYNYILPEAYLGREKASKHSVVIKENMANVDKDAFDTVNGYVLVERTLANGAVRRGIVGKIDLEMYDYSVGSVSPVRASEETVSDRLPPRAAVRSTAAVELPHILVFVSHDCGIIKAGTALEKRELYDFDLMEGGGHIKGYALEGKSADELSSAIAGYEASTALPYAVGDGNHSLAAAKLHYENLKEKYGDEMKEHPSRYALCEIVSIGDGAIGFEPIYRVMMNCDAEDVLKSLADIIGDGDEVEILSKKFTKSFNFTKRSHPLTVGTLQDFIDGYLAEHKYVVCDYIHGRKDAEKIAKKDGSVAFIFDGIGRDELLPYVEKNGVLPRKTFSMGEAVDKRYYLEARKIVK